MWNENGSASFGYWIWYVTLASDITHDLDLGCFKVKFRNSCISRIFGLIDVKWKGSELIGYRADYMTLTFDHTHDLDLGVSRSESEIALSQEWDGQLTWNIKDVSHPFMTMILTSVTMAGWADVPLSRLLTGLTSDVGVPSTYVVVKQWSVITHACPKSNVEVKGVNNG